MTHNQWANGWTAEAEIVFQHGLIHQGKFDLAKRYCEMVLRNERRWDPNVDLDLVMQSAEECLAILRAMKSGVAV